MFDFKKLEIADTADYQVTDAKGNPQYDDAGNAVTITMYSPGTKQGARAVFELNEARSARVMGQMSGKTSKRTEDDDNRERANFLVKVSKSLNNADYPGGLQALFQNIKLGHIADGAQKFFDDRGNFSADSASDASSTPATQPG